MNYELTRGVQGLYGHCSDFPDLSDTGRELLANITLPGPSDPSDDGSDSTNLVDYPSNSSAAKVD